MWARNSPSHMPLKVQHVNNNVDKISSFQIISFMPFWRKRRHLFVLNRWWTRRVTGAYNLWANSLQRIIVMPSLILNNLPKCFTSQNTLRDFGYLQSELEEPLFLGATGFYEQEDWERPVDWHEQNKIDRTVKRSRHADSIKNSNS